MPSTGTPRPEQVADQVQEERPLRLVGRAEVVDVQPGVRRHFARHLECALDVFGAGDVEPRASPEPVGLRRVDHLVHHVPRPDVVAEVRDDRANVILEPLEQQRLVLRRRRHRRAGSVVEHPGGVLVVPHEGVALTAMLWAFANATWASAVANAKVPSVGSTCPTSCRFRR